VTHPHDRIYRFTSRAHWGQGAAALGLRLAPEGGLITGQRMTARPFVRAEPGATIRLLAVDPCKRLTWLDSEGTVWVLAGGDFAVRAARIGPRLAAAAQRFVPRQDVTWLVADGDVLRLDARTGAQSGRFGAPGWRVIDGAAAPCDGVVVVEVGASGRVRLRHVRADGHARPVEPELPESRPLALTRADPRGPLSLLIEADRGWRELVIAGTTLERISGYPDDPDRRPGRAITGDGAGRLFLVGRRGFFAAGFGLVEPAMELDRVPGMGAILDLAFADGTLWAATTSGIFAIDAAAETGAGRQASWLSPPLHAPPDPRSGWQLAELRADLPKRARIRIRSRQFVTEAERDAYAAALRAEPGGALAQGGWDAGLSSDHSGGDGAAPLRHYLGDREAPWLALRIDISLPAGSPPARLERLDVTYPDRSLIESLPAIYRTGDSGEAKFRRMLAPFQALADEIDDLIGDAVCRVDPETAPDIWVGFLLGWLGHGAFSRLPPGRGRALLRALPRILAGRGTLAGLAAAIDALAPGGYMIEDDSLAPDIWVLPDRRDPAGARLGQETLAGPGAPPGLRLGRDPLGAAQVGQLCPDSGRLPPRCSTGVTVRVFGGEAAREALTPFLDRIARSFVPAHVRLRFSFDGHAPPELLDRARPTGPDDDPDSLFSLDPGRSLALGAWRLPGQRARSLRHQPATLDSAVLDGSLILA